MTIDKNDTNPDQTQNQNVNTDSANSDSAPAKNTNLQPASKPQTEQKQQPQQQGQRQGSRHYRGRSRGWNRTRDRDVLYEKAIKLAQSGRVEFLDNGVYNVIGDHGTYTVAVDHTGKLSCNCPGFIQKGICSHVAAVSLITKNRRRR